MKPRVEDCNLWDSGAHNVFRRINALEIGRIMQRREFDTVFDSPDHGFINDHGFGELLRAVHHAVTDSMNICQRTYPGNLGFSGDDPTDQVVESSPVVSQADGGFHRGPAGRLKRNERLTPDAFNKTFCFLYVCILLDDVEIGFDDLKFER